MVRVMRNAARRLAFSLLGLSVVTGVAWWLIMWQRGALARLPAPRAFPFLIGFAVVQLASWLLLGLVVLKARDVSSALVNYAVLLVSAGTLVATLLYFFTPVLGAPAAVLCILGLASLLVVIHRMQPV